MARRGITLPWADGDYAFKLTFDGLRELQESTGFGPSRLLLRIQNFEWGVWEVRELIRLSLIGGGMASGKALEMVRRYVETQPLMENATMCQLILSECLIGTTDEPSPGKDVGPKVQKDQIQPD